MKQDQDNQSEISPNTVIRGRIQGSENLWVEGRIDGEVDLDGVLMIQSEGVVKADVQATRIDIDGVLVGDASALDVIVLDKGARVVGDLKAPSIRFAEGACFTGALDIGDVEAARRDSSRAIPRARSGSTSLPAPSASSKVHSSSVSHAEEALKKTPVTSFAPASKLSPAEGRKKRVVVKKRGR